MKIKVLYFAQLKQSRGQSEDTLETDAATVGELYRTLAEMHHLGLPLEQIRTARNEVFCPATAPLQDGDTVAFMPPMSGG